MHLLRAILLKPASIGDEIYDSDQLIFETYDQAIAGFGRIFGESKRIANFSIRHHEACLL